MKVEKLRPLRGTKTVPPLRARRYPSPARGVSSWVASWVPVVVVVVKVVEVERMVVVVVSRRRQDQRIT